MLDVRVPPAHLWVPPTAVGTYGPDAGDLMAALGRPLDAEQQLAVDAMLSYDRGGEYVSLEQGIALGRQNGKSGGVLLAVALHDLLLTAPDRVIWTAHKVQTAMEAYEDVVTLQKNYDWLGRKVLKINRTGQNKSIEFRNGARLVILARVGGNGRGQGGKRVILDEALILDPSYVQALMPTTSARPEAQITYAGSAGIRQSAVWRGVRNRGRAGGDPSLTWVEWCAPGSFDDPPCERGRKCTHQLAEPGCTYDDPAAVQAANFAYPVRITPRYIEGERRAFSQTPELVIGWAVERLGWWDDPPEEGADAPITARSWAARLDQRSQQAEGEPVAVAWDVSPELASTSVSLVTRRADGDLHLELIKWGRGTRWLGAYLGGTGEPGSGLIERLELEEVWHMPSAQNGAALAELPEEVQEVCQQLTGAEVASACVRFARLVDPLQPGAVAGPGEDDEDDAEGGLWHLDDALLLAAVGGLRARKVGDGWVPTRAESTADISPVCASIAAVHGLLTADQLMDPTSEAL